MKLDHRITKTALLWFAFAGSGCGKLGEGVFKGYSQVAKADSSQYGGAVACSPNYVLLGDHDVLEIYGVGDGGRSATRVGAVAQLPDFWTGSHGGWFLARIVGNALFARTVSSPFAIFDLSTPQNPAILDAHPTFTLQDALIYEDRYFIQTDNGGVTPYDAADPKNITMGTHAQLFMGYSPGTPVWTSIYKNLLLAIPPSLDAVAIVSLADPMHPVELSHVALTDRTATCGASIKSYTAVGYRDRVYIGAESEDTNIQCRNEATIGVVDIGDPMNPKLLVASKYNPITAQEHPPGTIVKPLLASDDYYLLGSAYPRVVAGERTVGLHPLDVSDPTVIKDPSDPKIGPDWFAPATQWCATGGLVATGQDNGTSFLFLMDN